MKKSFEERHADNISRLKLILIAVCLIAIPATFYVNHHDVGSVKNRITKIESPCLKYSEEKTKENKRLCEESFENAVATITHPQACAIERKAGTLKAIRELAAELGVKFSEPCAGARLRQEEGRTEERKAASTAQESANTGTQPASEKNVGQGSPPAAGGKGSKPENGGHDDQPPSKPADPNDPNESTPTPPSPASPPPAEVPSESPAGEEPGAEPSKPGLLDPALELVCDTTKALNLCTKGTK